MIYLGSSTHWSIIYTAPFPGIILHTQRFFCTPNNSSFFQNYPFLKTYEFAIRNDEFFICHLHHAATPPPPSWPSPPSGHLRCEAAEVTFAPPQAAPQGPFPHVALWGPSPSCCATRSLRLPLMPRGSFVAANLTVEIHVLRIVNS